ncbi:MAG: hypothetical protein II894_05120 [Bacteroidales bacterium]|nr:hypothetical protein [Bacteroidales bacterium]
MSDLTLHSNTESFIGDIKRLLSQELTRTYGKGFSGRYLRAFRHFYLVVPDIEIWKSRFPNLTWTHYRALLRVSDADARYWYLHEASKEMWSVLTLICPLRKNSATR